MSNKKSYEFNPLDLFTNSKSIKNLIKGLSKCRLKHHKSHEIHQIHNIVKFTKLIKAVISK
jgi:hypothetical protein